MYRGFIDDTQSSPTKERAKQTLKTQLSH